MVTGYSRTALDFSTAPLISLLSSLDGLEGLDGLDLDGLGTI